MRRSSPISIYRQRAVHFYIICICLIAYGGSPRVAEAQTDIYGPIVTRASQPRPVTSWYVTTTDISVLSTLGCNDAKQLLPGPNLIILDFGYPWSQNGQQGVRILPGGSSTKWRTITEVENGVKAYLEGFKAANCNPSGATTRLVISVNNYDSPSEAGDYVNTQHGNAWIEMIRRIYDYVSNDTYLASKIFIRGGIDIELDWNSAADTIAWVDAYKAKAVYQGTTLSLYNFGTCEDCPNISTCPSTAMRDDWTMYKVWYVSQGSSVSYAWPEIYHRSGVNATQWYCLSLYAHQNYSTKLNILGMLTQWEACHDNNTNNNGCHSLDTDNTPEQGWTQLMDILNANSSTAITVNSASDIEWQ